MKPLLIDGEWLAGASTIQTINPSDLSETVETYVQADAQHAHAAVTAAANAAPDWAMSTPQQRHDILASTSAEIMARREEIGTLLSREEGKTLPEGIAETTRAAHIFGFFAGEALRQTGDILPSIRPNIGVEITREPVGVIGIIAPWNFPIAIPAWKIAPALAHGNTLVMKPADSVPGCAWALADILTRAGAPKGVINLVMGPGTSVGQAMLDDPRIDAITFTGSVATGARVGEASMRVGRKVQMEMGGKNPLVVLDDADLETAVHCALDGSFYSTGQRCTASSRLIVTEAIHGRFVETLVQRIRALTIGHALDPATDIGPVASRDQLDSNMRYVETARREGGNIRCGGETVSRATEGYFMLPTLITDTTSAMTINREEVFGPVASVIRVRDYEEALHVANDTPFGLSAGICTTSLRHATHFKRYARAGMVMVNLPTAGVDYHVPFGGTRASSHGPREQGRHAAEFFTTLKTAYTAT